MSQNNKSSQGILYEFITDLISDFPLEERVRIANLDQDDLKVLEAIFSKFIGNSLEQLKEQGNDELLEQCREMSGDKLLDDAGACGFILTELWKGLRDTHRVRVVK